MSRDCETVGTVKQSRYISTCRWSVMMETMKQSDLWSSPGAHGSLVVIWWLCISSSGATRKVWGRAILYVFNKLEIPWMVCPEMHGNHKVWQMDSRTDRRMDKYITIVPTNFVGKTTSQVWIAYYTFLVTDGLSWAIGRNLELTMLSPRLNQAHTPGFIPTALPIFISWDIESLLHEIWLWWSYNTNHYIA